MAILSVPTPGPVSPQLPQATLSPRLLWAQCWYDGLETRPTLDLSAFPDIQERRRRKKELKRKLVSVEFQSMLRVATRVLILDPHFDFNNGIQPLCDALSFSNALVVKINTRKSEDDDKIEAEVGVLRELLQDKAGSNTLVEVEVRRNAVLLPQDSDDLELHDRFAIVDNELWHFGSTCGGSYRGMTAHSRGWDVTATAAEGYFADLWGPK